MSAFDLFRFVTGALSGHRLRTVLSMLGVAIGVTAVVTLTSLGVGAREYVTDQFASLGTDLLIVVPGRSETTGALPGMGGTPRDLTLDDAFSITRRVRGVDQVAPLLLANETVSAGERSRNVAIVGTTAEFVSVRDVRLGRGEFLPAGDWDRGTPVAVLGHQLADELFPVESPIGRVVRIGEYRMRVVGVLADQGVNVGINFDDLALVPVATSLRVFDRTSLSRVMVKVTPGSDLDAVERQIRELLIERHADEEDFTLITQDALLSSFGAIFNALTLAIAGIAAISLTVAGIGIMNVMLVSVSERTAEIGLLKAVGVRSRQILAAFLLEAVLLSLAGGLLGLAVSWAMLAALGALYPAFPAAAPLWAVLAALGVSVAVGVAFGVLPARGATRLDPIAALRS
ncbi:MAG TPA: ABC transporter permease [Thermoanaerobaculia bacterium]|nr:ABC transporter permease [Thermoanaerobaculia bacterium]